MFLRNVVRQVDRPARGRIPPWGGLPRWCEANEDDRQRSVSVVQGMAAARVPYQQEGDPGRGVYPPRSFSDA
jgi:hypothetical protein